MATGGVEEEGVAVETGCGRGRMFERRESELEALSRMIWGRLGWGFAEEPSWRGGGLLCSCRRGGNREVGDVAEPVLR